MRVKVVFSIVALVAVVVFAAVAGAGKIGNGSSVGSAQVFVPNPVQSLGDESLTDQKDSDSAVPAAAYHAVQLTNLDGSGFLRGDYANVYSSTGNLAFSPTNTFAYTRHQDEFEQVMAYYWMTEAQKYIHSLGFGSTRRAIDNEPQRRPDQPARRGQLVRDRPSDGRAPLRQGRRRRRRGRRGDPARVRPRDPLSRRTSTSTRRRTARSARASATTGRSPSRTSSRSALGVPEHEPLPCVMDWDSTSYTSGPCRTACGGSTRTCTTRPT